MMYTEIEASFQKHNDSLANFYEEKTALQPLESYYSIVTTSSSYEDNGKNYDSIMPKTCNQQSNALSAINRLDASRKYNRIRLHDTDSSYDALFTQRLAEQLDNMKEQSFLRESSYEFESDEKLFSIKPKTKGIIKATLRFKGKGKLKFFVDEEF